MSNAPAVSRGFVNCIHDLEPKVAFIITPGSDTYTAGQEITIISLANFITTQVAQL